MKLLLKAVQLLPKDHYFLVYDGWRPYRVQLALYEMLKKQLIEKGFSGSKLKNELRKFVDKPSENPLRPANHLTGGAVDLTIANKNGPLNMGTNFDEFTDMARTDFFERIKNPDPEELRIIENRKLLKGIMEEVGFTNYEEEWWHFDYGNQNWALRKGTVAIYGGILKLNEPLMNK